MVEQPEIRRNSNLLVRRLCELSDECAERPPRRGWRRLTDGVFEAVNHVHRYREMLSRTRCVIQQHAYQGVHRGGVVLSGLGSAGSMLLAGGWNT
jgi:hypothetical protein